MKRIVVAALLFLTVTMMLPAMVMAQGTAKYDLDKVERVVVEALDKINVEKLTQENSAVFDKYKFSDEDVAQLKDATKTFTDSISEYAKAYKAAPADKKLPAPHDGFKDYCSKLQAFLEKYKVTCEDVLTVSKAAALMVMDEDAAKKSAAPSKDSSSLPTRDEVTAAFDTLLDFSRKYQIMASDLVPVIQSIGDIGLTVMEERVDIKKASEAEGYWRTKLAAFGASKEQSDTLFKSVMGLKRKYNMKMSDIKNLGDSISSQLKISPGSESDKEPDKGSKGAGTDSEK